MPDDGMIEEIPRAILAKVEEDFANLELQLEVLSPKSETLTLTACKTLVCSMPRCLTFSDSLP